MLVKYLSISWTAYVSRAMTCLFLIYFLPLSAVSEYYLSRHQTPALQRVPDDSTLIIVSDDPGFASNMTEMTLFILMMSFTQGEGRLLFRVDRA